MSDLTDAAKAEIKEAIRIVREDRFEKYVRERTAKVDPPTPKPNDPPAPTPPVPPVPPKPSDPPTPTPTDPPEKEHSRYWGEILR